MHVRKVLAIAVLALGAITLALAVMPKFQGGHFDRSLVIVSVCVIIIGLVSLRRARTV